MSAVPSSTGGAAPFDSTRIEQDEGFRRRPYAADAGKWQGLANHPKVTRPYRPRLGERLYLPLVAGLLVTLRHFARNLFGKLPTIQYPEERRNYSHRFRGHHILTTRPDGSVRCVACYLCAQACPAECIHIEAA